VERNIEFENVEVEGKSRKMDVEIREKLEKEKRKLAKNYGKA